MKQYRLLTGPDDAAFCARVTAALNDGWALQGSPTLTYDVAERRVICGQALVRTTTNAPVDRKDEHGSRGAPA